MAMAATTTVVLAHQECSSAVEKMQGQNLNRPLEDSEATFDNVTMDGYLNGMSSWDMDIPGCLYLQQDDPNPNSVTATAVWDPDGYCADDHLAESCASGNKHFFSCGSDMDVGTGFYDTSAAFVPSFTMQMPMPAAAGAATMVSVRPSTPAAASTRAARKSRMARKRRSVVKQLPAALDTSSVSASAEMITNNDDNKSQVAVQQQHKNLKFLLQKQLKPSDVGNLGRIVLPKKEAESRLPYLTVREGIILVMEDMTNSRKWNLRYRFWPNNKSRMYLLENTGEFVKSHRLCEGDYLLLYKDASNGNYVIYGKKTQGTEGISGEKRGLPQKQTPSELKLKRAKSLDSCESRVARYTPSVANTASRPSCVSSAAATPQSVISSSMDIKHEEAEEAAFVYEGPTGFDMTSLEHLPLLDSSELAIDEILDLVDLSATTV